MFIIFLLLFHVVFWVGCGTSLYRFLIFAVFLTFILLLESLADKDLRIIVSGLLPRKNIGLKRYNEKLKSLCKVMDIEFTNNFDSFLFASVEIPAAYFIRDKIHLNVNETRKHR